MTLAEDLAMPWAQRQHIYCAPGRITLKIALGEAPDDVPANRDVRLGASAPGTQIDGGPVDRVLSRFSDDVRVARVHVAASSGGVPGVGGRGYDDLEEALGLSRTFRVHVDPSISISDLVDALRQLAVVETVSPQYVCSVPFATALAPAPIELERAWVSRDQVRATEAMAYEPGDAAVVIAVVDTGVEAGHPELQQRLRRGFDTVKLGDRDLARGIELLGDIGDEDGDPNDEVGHGTGCAGIIGGSGQQIPAGLAGDCGLLPMRVLCSARVPGRMAPIGIGSLPDIDEGVKRSIDLGAKVLNMSFGTPKASLEPDDPLPHLDVVRYGLARGCVMVAASGNSGKGEPFYPSAHDGVIAVGSVDDDDRPSSFTTFGPHVSLCAPGERVVSAGIGGYQAATGSSFAAPFVAAAAALLVSRASRRATPIDGRDVLRILGASARPWSSGAPRGYGSGILDAAAALRMLDDDLDTPRKPLGTKARSLTREGGGGDEDS
jgi:subtilisin family serine protease